MNHKDKTTPAKIANQIFAKSTTQLNVSFNHDGMITFHPKQTHGSKFHVQPNSSIETGISALASTATVC